MYLLVNRSFERTCILQLYIYIPLNIGGIHKTHALEYPADNMYLNIDIYPQIYTYAYVCEYITI
jgi:hypothetical protein